MKQKFLLPLALLAFTTVAFAQKKKLTAYAITSANQGQYVWTEVKLIDLATGEVIQQVYQNSKNDYQVYDARQGKTIQVKDSRGAITDNTRMPFATFSAACAYDKKHNRLYYTPMFINELRYIDLNARSPKIYYFTGETLSKAASLTDEANHITRMVIGADGNGYAISNDGNHFIRFTTGRKPVITDLGPLQDHADNKGLSVHNRCSSWGGDMIAAADGSLYLVSANRAVFRIDPSTRTAKYINNISGLPGNFTTNGAVVAESGKMVVSSAAVTQGYYEVDMKSWVATKIESNGAVFNTSDLANGNIAFQDETRAETTPLFTRTASPNNKISLYPNPVSEGMFRVSFDSDELGRYEIQLVDLTGRILLQKPVAIANKGQVVEIELNRPFAKGMYMVKVLGANKKSVHSDKIMIE
jgi:hypothetical protein